MDGSERCSRDSPEDGVTSDRTSLVEGSAVARFTRDAIARAVTITRASFLFRWLTKEPEPEVIVIDLRETWTVGPIIALLDRFVEAAAESRLVAVGSQLWRALLAAPVRAAGVGTAGLSAAFLVATLAASSPSWGALAFGTVLFLAGVVATRDGRDWETLRETRPVELLAAAFELPEPPARATDEGTAADAVDEEDTESTEDDHTT